MNVVTVPVVAAEELQPGQKVGFVEGSNHQVVSGNVAAKIGVIDPILDRPVPKDTSCYLIMFPY